MTGKQIAHFRSIRGISQAELTDRINRHYPQIALMPADLDQMETEDRLIRSKEGRAIINCLGLRAAYFSGSSVQPLVDKWDVARKFEELCEVTLDLVGFEECKELMIQAAKSAKYTRDSAQETYTAVWAHDAGMDIPF